MNLHERIDAAIERITSGQALMRVPVDDTDPDTVLADCQRRIAELESQRDEAGAALREAAAAFVAEDRERLRLILCDTSARTRAHTLAIEAEHQRDDLRAALVQAREDMIGWAAYADAYYQDKWDLAGDIAAIDAALEKSNGQ